MGIEPVGAVTSYAYPLGENFMITLFNELLKAMDGERLLENTEKLWKIELGQCHRNYREAAKFTERLMQESGLKQVERIGFPADGKTDYSDKTMPLAWDATMGRLTVLHSSSQFENPVVADFHRHPFHLARGSVSTPPGGIVTRLITEEQLFGGCETANAMVITNPETRPRADLYARLCDLGALGVVNIGCKADTRRPTQSIGSTVSRMDRSGTSLPMTGRSSGSASARGRATRCARRRERATSWCASSPTAACTKTKWTWSPGFSRAATRARYGRWPTSTSRWPTTIPPVSSPGSRSPARFRR